MKIQKLFTIGFPEENSTNGIVGVLISHCSFERWNFSQNPRKTASVSVFLGKDCDGDATRETLHSTMKQSREDG